MKISFEEWWYEKIFKEYSKPRKKNLEVTWLFNTLKRLKQILELTNDIHLVKNTLLILINLLDEGPIDNYEKVGKDIKRLTFKERENIKRMLKKTLIMEKIEEH
jgi:hypothetical protein